MYKPAGGIDHKGFIMSIRTLLRLIPIVLVLITSTTSLHAAAFQQSTALKLTIMSATPTPTVAPKSLFSWNIGGLQNQSGWQWLDDVAYGNPGWILLSDGPLGGGETYSWGKGPRSFNKGDYGRDNTAEIDMYDRAPSTQSGGSLLVRETDISTDHRSTWWVWYDGKPLSKRNISDARTNRMSFYLKTQGTATINDDGGAESVPTTFHIGSYLCWYGTATAYGTGDGCPYEGPGNQHYYHYLGINPNAWIHVLLDQHPQHLRGIGRVNNNPAYESAQKNYFEHFMRFYMEIRSPQAQMTNYRIDEIEYYSTLDTEEPAQNDISIASLWIGYWSDSDNWEIGFHDGSFDSYNNDSWSTFEARYSTRPISNANYAQATPIEFTLYSGARYTGENNNLSFRRSNSWKSNLWTRFKLPDELETAGSHLYFAIKDISRTGQHIGTDWPWNRASGDGHDAPSNFIKTIDYHIASPSMQ